MQRYVLADLTHFQITIFEPVEQLNEWYLEDMVTSSIVITGSHYRSMTVILKILYNRGSTTLSTLSAQFQNELLVMFLIARESSLN